METLHFALTLHTPFSGMQSCALSYTQNSTIPGMAKQLSTHLVRILG